MQAVKRKTILYVPGKRPKPPPAVFRERLWRALLAGVRSADPRAAAQLAENQQTFQLIGWNPLYYGQNRTGEEDEVHIDALIEKAGPSPEDIREALSWRSVRARWLYTLADLMPFVIPLLPDKAVRSTIAETLNYFQNSDNIGRQVRELLKAPLRELFKAGHSVMIIAHSMGSIIAYDALWELWHEEHNHGRIDVLLTLGSPLGMNYVQDRLIGFHNHNGSRFPGNIRVWKNLATEGDLTALDPTVRDDFSPMLALGAESIEDIHEGLFGYFRNQDGLNVHRSYGYLVQPVLGRIVADWLCQEAVTKQMSAPKDKLTAASR